MSDHNSVGLVGARGLCEALRRAGVPSGPGLHYQAPKLDYYLWSLDAPERSVWVSLTYNERMDIKDWDRFSESDRSKVPLRHQPQEVRQARISQRDQEGL